MKKRLRRILSFLLMGCLVMCQGISRGESVFTDKMLARSFVSAGNTERIQRAIKKAQNGEEVTIVYLGGSITEGALASPQKTNCYAALSSRAFAEKYMQKPGKLRYVNAGISGTPSLLGITRLEQDVLSHKPDIVFVEFAVNDSNDDVSKMVYESLIRKLLTSETEPAVVLIFTLLNSFYSCQPHMMQVGKHYDLGMVSVYNAVQPEIQLGLMKWSDYSTDYAHPTNEGHAFIADAILNFFENAEKTESAPYTMPIDTKYGNILENLKNIRPGDEEILSEGSFPYGDATCYSYKKGWRHLASKGGTENIIFKVTSSYMTLAFKQMNNPGFGTAQVYVDGVLKDTLEGSSASAWGNVVTKLIDLGEMKEHTVEIRMREGDENLNFQLLDAAYARD